MDKFHSQNYQIIIDFVKDFTYNMYLFLKPITLEFYHQYTSLHQYRGNCVFSFSLYFSSSFCILKINFFFSAKYLKFIFPVSHSVALSAKRSYTSKATKTEESKSPSNAEHKIIKKGNMETGV